MPNPKRHSLTVAFTHMNIVHWIPVNCQTVQVTGEQLYSMFVKQHFCRAINWISPTTRGQSALVVNVLKMRVDKLNTNIQFLPCNLESPTRTVHYLKIVES